MDEPTCKWAQDTLSFLGRAQIQGNEAPNFMFAVQQLDALAKGRLMLVPVNQETTEPALENGNEAAPA